MDYAKLGDLLASRRHLVCETLIRDDEGHEFLVARPPTLTGRYSVNVVPSYIAPDTVALVVRDRVGSSSEMKGVLIDGRLYAVWPDHFRVLQSYESCHAG